MSSLIDHLTALATGIGLLTSIVTIQMRDRVETVETTVSDVAQAQATAAADLLAQEFDNALSEGMAVAALGKYRCTFVRDATNDHTTSIEVPAFVRAVRGGPVQAATVRYRLKSAGRTVDVGGGLQPVYQLTREVDTRSGGYSAPKVVADGLVDFDVKFRGRASETFVGGPPLRFSQIAFQLVVAVPPAHDLPGRVRTRHTNTSRAVFAVRPPNLRTSA